MEENKIKRKMSLISFLLIVAVVLVIIAMVLGYLANSSKINSIFVSDANIKTAEELAITDNSIGEDKEIEEEENDITIPENENLKNYLSEFDLSFLKEENPKKNMIYSPLSIKYALKMLEDGSEGESKTQIFNALGDYKFTKYRISSHLSLANSLFIRERYKNDIKKEYINLLKNKYEADVIFDSFESPDNVNSWISKKTLNLIPNMIDEISDDKNFILINALGIDMEWKDKFCKEYGLGQTGYYSHEKFEWFSKDELIETKFNKKTETVSSMEAIASINNYDIVKELGEDDIRSTVGNEYKKYLKKEFSQSWLKESVEKEIDIYKKYGKLKRENSDFEGSCLEDYGFKLNDVLNMYSKISSIDEISEDEINKAVNKCMDSYIEEINTNYRKVEFNNEFSLYDDEDVKVFAKDLKKYNGAELQYIGIMPKKDNLDNYVKNINEEKIKNIIKNLKELKSENFKEGVVTYITGLIPKFKFEYELNLKDDLIKLGITDVFEEGKANLIEICNDEDAYINSALHKANIEFTQEGIKAAASTIIERRRRWRWI